MSNAFRPATDRNGDQFEQDQQRTETMEIPIFPLKNVVLFPGMVLPLHIFEMRYREMINRCVDERLPFGVVLIKEGQEVGAAAVPHMTGTLARILRIERLEDGCMNIHTIGVERFQIEQIHKQHSYLTATVRTLPTLNGSTKVATELAQKMRPRLYEYVELLSKANETELKLDRLPEEPTTLAFLVAIALQVSPTEKQSLLERPGIPELLVRELNLLAHEKMMLRYMVATQREMQTMNAGMTGGIFPN
ncbi:MAG: LON peptidase substrate-binding domain-containing protein [Caldilineaceae bacterium]|nr:LON peptidase substrate-binding domain-containing protein [Caldilineaceae bacterium]